MNQNNLWEKDLKKRDLDSEGIWFAFSKSITEEKINQAENDLKKFIGLDSLNENVSLM